MYEKGIYKKDRFAGKSAEYPNKGDLVEVIEGDYVGETFAVLFIGGYAFNPVYKIFIKGPDDEIIWYWPWNLKIHPKEP